MQEGGGGHLEELAVKEPKYSVYFLVNMTSNNKYKNLANLHFRFLENNVIYVFSLLMLIGIKILNTKNLLSLTYSI